MKTKGLLFMLLACAATSGLTAHAEEVPSGERITTPYVSLSVPAGAGWQVRRRSDTAIALARGEPDNSFAVAALLFRMGPADSPEEYEALIKRAAAEDGDPANPDRYRLLEQSIKYSSERAYPCVRFAATSEDRAARGAKVPLFLELYGLYCRHPADPSIGVTIMYSHRGLTRHPDLAEEAEAYLRDVVLTTP
jgi:hypothetical protein